MTAAAPSAPLGLTPGAPAVAVLLCLSGGLPPTEGADKAASMIALLAAPVPCTAHLTVPTDDGLPLLRSGAVSVGGPDPLIGGTPLQHAAAVGHTDCALSTCLFPRRFNRNCGIDTVSDRLSRPALSHAVVQGHTHTVDVLVAAGASPLLDDANGLNAVFHAIWRGHTDMLRSLVVAGGPEALTRRAPRLTPPQNAMEWASRHQPAVLPVLAELALALLPPATVTGAAGAQVTSAGTAAPAP